MLFHTIKPVEQGPYKFSLAAGLLSHAVRGRVSFTSSVEVVPSAKDLIYIWRGTFVEETSPPPAPITLIAKLLMAPDQAYESALRNEAKMYDKLEDLQGTYIPKFYGLYTRVEGEYAPQRHEPYMVLLVEDCGNAYESWSQIENASFETRCARVLIERVDR